MKLRQNRWHHTTDWRTSHWTRRINLEDFEGHSIILNSKLPAYSRPVLEAFEVREDIEGETIGVVWSTPTSRDGGLDLGRKRNRFDWYSVDAQMQMFPVNSRSRVAAARALIEQLQMRRAARRRQQETLERQERTLADFSALDDLQL